VKRGGDDKRDQKKVIMTEKRRCKIIKKGRKGASPRRDKIANRVNRVQKSAYAGREKVTLPEEYCRKGRGREAL
jgi:hypothetical protein